MTDFKITGTITSKPTIVEIEGEKYLAFIIRHGENQNKELPIYFGKKQKEKALDTKLNVADVITIEGNLYSRRVVTFVKKPYESKKRSLEQLRLLPIIEDFTYISRSTTGRVIQSTYLSKLLALEEIGGK